MKLFGGVHPFYKVIAIFATVDKMESIHKWRLNLKKLDDTPRQKNHNSSTFLLQKMVDAIYLTVNVLSIATALFFPNC